MARVYEKKPMGERLSKYLVDPVTGCWNWTFKPVLREKAFRRIKTENV